jgi:DnaJ-domain-containing protein 1
MNWNSLRVVSRLARQPRSRHSPSFPTPPSRTQVPFQLVVARPLCGTRTSLSWPKKSRQCHFSSSAGGTSTSNLLSGNPFAVLGVAVNSSFVDVRLAFVKLALEHHPDRESGSTEKFLKVRKAFEEIQQGQNGNDGSSEGNSRNSSRGGRTPSGWTQDELREWYQDETGDFATFAITESTRQEVIRVYKTMLKSGKAVKGGYWDFARQLVEEEDARGGSDDDGPTKLLGDTSKQPSIGRRKRQRR